MLAIQKELKKYSSSKKVEILQRFFKTNTGEYGEGDKFIGIVVPDIRKVVKQNTALSLNEIVILLHSPVHEERLCALLILVAQYKQLDREDSAVGGVSARTKKKIYQLYLKNYKFINNWDLVDLTAPNIVGAYLRDKPKDILYQFAKSKNLWKRRIAILETFDDIYHKKSEETLKIAKILLHDEHDLIHKAVGWMLREVGKRVDEKVLLKFLDEHYKTMPRTMLRYAIERLSEPKRLAYLRGKI